jgi:hypothetical protein
VPLREELTVSLPFTDFTVFGRECDFVNEVESCLYSHSKNIISLIVFSFIEFSCTVMFYFLQQKQK